MDMSRFQQGATYEQIQEWVQEKYGFHVTHLNITQVKRKHGIIERKNCNKPKSPDSKQPGCPRGKGTSNRGGPEIFPNAFNTKNLPEQEVIVKNVIRLPLDFFGYRSIIQLGLANFIYTAFFQRKHLSDKDSFFSNYSRWLAIANIGIGALL